MDPSRDFSLIQDIVAAVGPSRPDKIDAIVDDLDLSNIPATANVMEVDKSTGFHIIEIHGSTAMGTIIMLGVMAGVFFLLRTCFRCFATRAAYAATPGIFPMPQHLAAAPSGCTPGTAMRLPRTRYSNRLAADSRPMAIDDEHHGIPAGRYEVTNDGVIRQLPVSSRPPSRARRGRSRHTSTSEVESNVYLADLV